MVYEENYSLKKHVDSFDSLNLNLKYEILKMSIGEKRKGVISDTEKRVKSDLKECKIDYFCEKEKVIKVNQDILS